MTDSQRKDGTPDPIDPNYTEWHHATNASNFREGQVFGWRDNRSETGWLSGIVVAVNGLAVQVRDLRAAQIRRQEWRTHVL